VIYQTHSRWIRDKDPLNIYRYSEQIYKMSHFRGQPNRVGVEEYRQYLVENNWENIIIEPIKELNKNNLKTIRPYLSKKFRNREFMSYLVFRIYAVKK